MLDDLDRRILRHFQVEPNIAMGELAMRASTTPAVLSRRLSKLRETGVIVAHEAIINWAALGFGVEVSLRIKLDKTNASAFDDFLREARKVREVIEIQTFLGRVDVRLTVIARDMSDYQRIYRENILKLPHIAEVEALMQVAQIKVNDALPL